MMQKISEWFDNVCKKEAINYDSIFDFRKMLPLALKLEDIWLQFCMLNRSEQNILLGYKG